jgi:hypothetical protein
MIGTYFLAYVGSRRVIDLPLNLVAPERVKKMNTNRKAATARVIANLVRAWNYSAFKFFLTYSIMTNAFIIMKTK